jgi:hypothetical protein
MATKQKLVDDIILRVSRGKPSDDFELESDQVAHWLDITRDSLVAAKLSRMITAGVPVDPIYIERDECNSADIYDNGCSTDDDCYVRHTFDLTSEPISLPGDGGIINVSTQSGILVYKTSTFDFFTIKHLKWAKPKNEERMVWERQGAKMFIHGMGKRTKKYTKFNVYFVRSYTDSPPAMDDEFKVDEQLYTPMMEQVEQIAMREVFGPFEDLENDGTQGVEPR